MRKASISRAHTNKEKDFLPRHYYKDSQDSAEMQFSTQIPHQPPSDIQNNTPEAPVVDSTTASVSSNKSRNASREYVQKAQDLIEWCLKLYMNKDEVINYLQSNATIKPETVTEVWQRLEKHNKDFFSSYYKSLILKTHIKEFNQLLEEQYHQMTNSEHPNVPMAPMQGIHHMPSHAQIDSMSSMSSYHVVNGIPEAGILQPMHINSGKDMVMDRSAANMVPISPASSIKPGMSTSSASVAYNGQLSFTQTEILEPSVNTSALDSTFTSHVAIPDGLQLGLDGGPGNSKESLPSSSQIFRNFSYPEIPAEWIDMEADYYFPNAVPGQFSQDQWE